MSKPKLPNDPYGNNRKRAKWAGDTLKYFGTICPTDEDDLLKDLLCNLMHWADRNDRSFDAALMTAIMHYEAETHGEP